MTLKDFFDQRSEYPELTDSEYMLFMLWLWRLEGSKLTDENGKFIYPQGENDPVTKFGWTEDKSNRVRRGLIAKQKISFKREGWGGKYRVSILPYFAILHTMEKCHPILGKNTTLYMAKMPSISNKKEKKRKDKGKEGKPPTNDLSQHEILMQMLEEEKRKNEQG